MTDKSDVNDANASAMVIFQRAQFEQAPASVRGVIGARAAFMAEFLVSTGKTDMPRQCKTLDVLLVQRSDGAIIKHEHCCAGCRGFLGFEP